MAIRYFQFVTWEKWYPRKEYKSMPWVKLSTRFFEDPKLDGLSTQEMLGIIWLICECGRQNHGDGRIRVNDKVMRESLQLWRKVDAQLILNCAVRIGVLIEESLISEHGSSKQELRVRGRIRNPPTPLALQKEEIRVLPKWVGNEFPQEGSGTGKLARGDRG